MRRVRAGCAAWRCDVNPWGDAVRAYGRALAVLAAREGGRWLLRGHETEGRNGGLGENDENIGVLCRPQRHDVNCSICLSHPSQQCLHQHRPHLNQRAYYPPLRNRAALLKMLTLLAAIIHISILTILDLNPIEIVLCTPPSLVMF